MKDGNELNHVNRVNLLRTRMIKTGLTIFDRAGASA